jgi:hypothetical protein
MITVLPPDPRLQGWPEPYGTEYSDLPGWLLYSGFVRGSWLAAVDAAKQSGWKAIGFNCFQKRSLGKCK